MFLFPLFSEAATLYVNANSDSMDLVKRAGKPLVFDVEVFESIDGDEAVLYLNGEFYKIKILGKIFSKSG